MAMNKHNLSLWVADKLHLQQLAVEVAQATQLEAELTRFDKEGPRVTTSFPAGSFVLVEDPPNTHKNKLWEPWYDSKTGAGLRDNAVVHAYLREQGLERLIPKTQRT